MLTVPFGPGVGPHAEWQPPLVSFSLRSGRILRVSGIRVQCPFLRITAHY